MKAAKKSYNRGEGRAVLYVYAIRGLGNGKQETEGLLTAALREHWGLLERPKMDRGKRGKPWFPDRPDIQFNLSHSGPYAFCAVSGRPVGVDVERVCPRRAALPRGTLSEEEYRWYQVRGARWEDFYTLWTLKEASVKWSGQGLERSARSIAVPLLESGQSAWLAEACFTALEGPGWRAAVCGEGPAEGIKWL